MSRTARALDHERQAIAALQMIEAHAGKPCPTRREIAEWTGVPRRQVWIFLHLLAGRGLIEVEIKNPLEIDGSKRRRLRVAGGRWTDWTYRGDAQRARAARWPELRSA